MNKIDKLKLYLDENNIFYNEYKNGHIKVDNVSIWVESEKWYDSDKKIKGRGINSYVIYIKRKIDKG